MMVYKPGTVIKVAQPFRREVFNLQYGVVKSVKYSDQMPIVSVILPLDNGMKLNANLAGHKITPVELEEVEL
jgi:hypothetical protein